MNEPVSSDYIYLDWAATAPLRPEALDAMMPFLAPGRQNIPFGMNPNSLHTPGRTAFAALEDARRQIARCIGARRPSEVVFASGATEANNAALFGMARAVACERKAQGKGAQPLSVVTSALEHDAVLHPAEQLHREGFDLVKLAPTRAGFIEPSALDAALGEIEPGGVALVSIQAANSEIGSMQPVAELARIAHAHGALFHVDATQALGKVEFLCEPLGIDAASFSAHKVGGPKGVGALYLRARTPFQPLLLGGGQESGLRSTTQNVCGIAGFAAACQAALANREEESARQRTMRDWLYRELTKIDGIQPAVLPPEGSTDYLPNIVTVLVSGWESETLILRLDALGFGVSGGSACSSQSLDASHVLRSLGIDADLALGELRISFGSLTSEDDLRKFVRALTDCIA